MTNTTTPDTDTVGAYKKTALLVIPETFVYSDTSFPYAAHWRTVRLEAGEYPISWTTIAGTPPWEEALHRSGSAYYGVAQVPGTVVGAAFDLRDEVGQAHTQYLRWYQYQVVEGGKALFDREADTIPYPTAATFKVIGA